MVAARGAVLFLVAWSLTYWQAWVFLGVDLIGAFGTTWYLIRYDTDLLARRLKVDHHAEQQDDRRRALLAIRLAMLVTLVVGALDHRYGWSHVPAAGCLVGDAVIASGLTLVWVTLRTNSFASTIIELHSGQQVISTGPYAFVRHPMYTGMILTASGMAIALGSLWALAGAAMLIVAVVLRLQQEEQLLASSLAGYEDYRAAVRHRLAPLVW
jgi:protein-S-isoprenylcysteine O-methyltransferase Ste14